MSALGVKRTCPGCGAKFYDLGKNPASCPKCGKSFAVDVPSPEKKAKKLKPPKPAKPLKPVILATEDEDIDLTGFDAPEVEAADDAVESLDEIADMEEGIESLTEVEEREREEDHMNSDDGEDDAFIEEMDEVETLVDRPEDDLEDEDMDEEE